MPDTRTVVERLFSEWRHGIIVRRLIWNKGAYPQKIAKRCRDFLLRYGIESHVYGASWIDDGEHTFNLRIITRGFPIKLSDLDLVLRESEYITGATFFKDVSDAAVQKGRKYVSGVMTSDKVDESHLALATSYNLGILSINDLTDFALALKGLKEGRPTEYLGRSTVLRRFFMENADSVSEARRHDQAAREEKKRGNWPGAEQHWRACVALDREMWHAHLELAESLVAQNKHAAAASVLTSALGEYPHISKIPASLASLAEAQGDWEEAASRWNEVIARFPEDWVGYRGKISTLRKSGRAAEADEFLATHTGACMRDENSRHDVARFGERTKDWALASSAWQEFIALNDKMDWAYIGLCRALRAQGHDERAEEVLYGAIARLPGFATLKAEVARWCEQRGEWDQALAQWERVIIDHPQRWVGYAGKVAALRAAGRSAEADAFMRANLNNCPGDQDAHHDRARYAERVNDWGAAAASWEAFIAINDRMGWAYVGLSRALRELGKPDLADETLRRALDRLPFNPELQSEAARRDELAGDWASSTSRWARLTALWPDNSDGHRGQARGLRKQSKTGDADRVISAALLKLPNDPGIHEEYALNAMWDENWSAALDRLKAATERFPNENRFRTRLYEVGLRLADSGAAAETLDKVGSKGGNLPSDRSAVTHFESLGGGSQTSGAWGFGCEFGYFQRHVGFEPLSLLRWCSIAPMDLVDALNSNFEGIDDPAYMEMRKHTGSDWGVVQHRYKVIMDHTALDRGKVSAEKAKEKMSATFRFLRDKLLTDLRDGKKIFVYRVYDHTLSDDLVKSLAVAVRRHGPAKFLYVQKSDAEHPAFTVETRKFGLDNLLVGYIDYFAPQDGALTYNNSGWQKLCEEALRAATSGDQGRLSTPSSDFLTNRLLVTYFESLGGGGHGCEFGIFQRHFGAEPLGLLRWADIYQDALSTALETEFDGIGDPEFTRLFIPPTSDAPEYWTRDTRYHMAMRCFVLAEQVPFEKMMRQVTKRLSFLRSKLIEDLREGSKVFVYKNMKRNLTPAEVARLHSACRKYGNNTLLYIRYQDEMHRCGQVDDLGDGLLIGYVDHFSHTPDTDEYIKPATESLLLICRRAYQLWRNTASSPEDGR